jgi:hypothetical protein
MLPSSELSRYGLTDWSLRATAQGYDTDDDTLGSQSESHFLDGTVFVPPARR